VKQAVDFIGDEVWKKFKFFENTKPVENDNVELMLNQTWRPQLTITGQEGLPDLKGGNVLRTDTTVKVSLRVPPTFDVEKGWEKLKNIFEESTPYNSTVSLSQPHLGGGWNGMISTKNST
jgi:hypothetical protein